MEYVESVPQDLPKLLGVEMGRGGDGEGELEDRGRQPESGRERDKRGSDWIIRK